MKISITLCFCVISLLASQIAKADIYKRVELDGQVTYSNVKTKGSVKLDLVWEKIGVTGKGETFYVNPDSIRTDGGKVKMWDLVDYEIAQNDLGGNGLFLSYKIQREYDCKKEQARVLYATAYSGNMGSGETVFSYNTPTAMWEPVVPQSIAESLWKFACSKK